MPFNALVCKQPWFARFTLSPISHLYTLRVSLPSYAHQTSPASAPPAPSCDCRSLTQPTLLLHHRLGHPNFPLLRSMFTSKLLHGLPSSLPPLPPSLAPPWTPCVQAKLSQSPHPSSPSSSPKPLDLVGMDLWGRSPIASHHGHRYFLLLVDDHSRFATVYPLRAKSDAPSLIIRWAEQARLHFGHPIARFHFDGGGEFFNHSLSSYYASHGICQTSTLLHSPKQNGIAERRNRILMEITRCPLTHASAPHSLWSYALLHATLLCNLRPHPLRPTTTPFQLWTRRQPSICHLRVWVCGAHVLVNPEDRSRQGGKLAPKTQLCAFIGIKSDCPGYPFYVPSSQQLICGQDVIFDETCSPFLTPPPAPPAPSLHWSDFDPPPSVTPSPPSSPPLPPPPAPPLPPASNAPPSDVISGASPRASSSSAPMPSSPPSSSPLLPSWMVAIIAECEAFIETHSYVHSVPPPDTTIVKGKWVFRVKQLPGELSVFKVRYCAKGFTQREVIDYFATYSPTAHLPTLCLLDLGARWDWEIHSMDLSNAFLKGELHERIFLERPAGFPRPFPPGTVPEPKCPVYGLKQAPREWHAKRASTLHSLGFSTSSSDPTLFIRTSPHRLYILAYVDDLVLLSEDSADLAAVKQALGVCLLCKDLGELCH
ncbi:unnamed protein product [Closterium sp. NIES-53]